MRTTVFAVALPLILAVLAAAATDRSTARSATAGTSATVQGEPGGPERRPGRGEAAGRPRRPSPPPAFAG